MAKRALLIGVDSYDSGDNLTACAADAEAMSAVLARHKNGDINFECITCLDESPEGNRLTRPVLRQLARDLFTDFRGEILFYFSGHGALTEEGGYLCTTDAAADDWGVPMQEIVGMAINSPASDVLFLLDCCHSGNFANPDLLRGRGGSNPIATIRENMTVIAASRDLEPALEEGGHGRFTAALLDALEGGASDHLGYVTAPTIYCYIERRFGSWDQRPVYKSHTLWVPVVRECEPLIEKLKLRHLTAYFPSQDHKYQLDPDYEPEDENGKKREVVNQKKVDIGRLFKEYRDAGLLKASIAGEDFFWAAQRSHTVELTARGKEYRWLVANNKI